MSPAAAASSIRGPTMKSIGGRIQENLDLDVSLFSINEMAGSAVEEFPTSGNRGDSARN